MELRRYRDGDFGLTEALETDPLVMRELGGPIDPAWLPDLHRSRLVEPWWFTIALEPGGPSAGTIGIWEGRPAVSNGPSNALCRTAGFVLLGPRKLDFRGHALECNHWMLSFPAGTEPAAASEAPDA